MGVCQDCGSLLTLRHELAIKRGLVLDLRICCTITACSKEKISDPYAPAPKNTEHQVYLGDKEYWKRERAL